MKRRPSYADPKFLLMNPAVAEFTLSFSHRIYYTNRELVPAEEIAEALLALNRIVQRAPHVFQGLVPGTALPTAQLYIERLASGSLDEEIKIKLFFGSKRKMDRTLKRWREKFGIDLNTKGGVIRTIVIALILFGGYQAATHLLGDKEKAAIEISHNTIINIGAKELNLTADDIVKVIHATVSNKAQLAHDSVKVIRPAKSDPAAEIHIDGQPDLKITANEIAAIPFDLHIDKAEESERREHIEIHLRANDLDNTERGWAAVVPAVTGRRLRMELAPEINADELYGKKEIKGTVEIIKRKDTQGRMQLRSYRLESIDPD